MSLKVCLTRTLPIQFGVQLKVSGRTNITSLIWSFRSNNKLTLANSSLFNIYHAIIGSLHTPQPYLSVSPLHWLFSRSALFTLKKSAHRLVCRFRNEGYASPVASSTACDAKYNPSGDKDPDKALQERGNLERLSSKAALT